MRITSALLLTGLIWISLTNTSCKKDKDEAPVTQPITLDCQDITSDKTFVDVVSTAGAVDYIVPCDISIDADVVVNAGVVFQFKTGTGFSIGNAGSLKVNGTASAPVAFHGESSASGVWKGLRFNSGNVNNSLNHVTITGGGSGSFDGKDIRANIRVDVNARIKLNNSTISNSGRDGVYVDGTASVTENTIEEFSSNQFNGNANYPLSIPAPSAHMVDAATTFSSNGNQVIFVRPGVIETGVSWIDCQVPYLVGERVYISTAAGMLTIQEGTTIKFKSGAGIGTDAYEQAALKINGTAANRVTLTGEAGTPGSWSGICFQSTNANNEIKYADISFGGGGNAWSGSTADKGNIVVGAYSAGSVNVSNTSVTGSASCGIKVKTGSTLTQGTGNVLNNNTGGNICN